MPTWDDDDDPDAERQLVSVGVYAGAYLPGHLSKKRGCLTHYAVMTKERKILRVFCGKVRIDNLCEGNPAADKDPVTCKKCIAALPAEFINACLDCLRGPVADERGR